MLAFLSSVSFAPPPLSPTAAAVMASAWKSAIGFALAYAIASTVLRRRSAAARHLAWTAAATVALAMPLAAATLPAWRVWPAAAVSADARLPALPAPAAPMPNESGAAAAGPVGGTAAADRATRSPWRAIALVWLAGAIAVATPTALGQIALRRLTRRCTRTADPAMVALLGIAQRRADVRRPVLLLVADGEVVPMTCGVFRPTILLPADAATWTEERRRNVLLHELAHVRRLDCLTHGVALAARAVHWFNPLAWLAVAKMASERERACDDAVLREGVRASTYAGDLLAFATRLGANRLAANAAMPMARRESDLIRRVQAVLDAEPRRTPPSSRAVPALLALALASSVPAAIVAAADPTPADAAVPTPSVVPASPAAASTPAPANDGEVSAATRPLWGGSTSIDNAGRHLRQAGQLLWLYAERDRAPRYPHTLGALLLPGAGNDGAAAVQAVAGSLLPDDHDAVPADVSPDWIDAHTRVVYLAADADPHGWDAATRGATIVLHTPLDAPMKHAQLADVIVAGFADGHCEIVPLADAPTRVMASKQTIDAARAKP